VQNFRALCWQLIIGILILQFLLNLLCLQFRTLNPVNSCGRPDIPIGMILLIVCSVSWSHLADSKSYKHVHGCVTCRPAFTLCCGAPAPTLGLRRTVRSTATEWPLDLAFWFVSFQLFFSPCDIVVMPVVFAHVRLFQKSLLCLSWFF